MKKNLIFLFSFFVLAACTKSPGFGGLSTIQGKVYAVDYKANTTLIEAEGYTSNVKVYIQVEGENNLLDEVKTNLDGAYAFQNLRKGNYVVWTYTYHDSSTNNSEAIIQKVNIDSRKKEITLPDFKIDI